MALLKRATWLLAVLAVVLLVATVLLAHNRLRAGLWLALGCVVAMVLSRTVVHRVVDDAPSLVPGAAGQAAIADILGEATRGLLRLTGLIVILAVLVVVWTLFRRGWIGHDLLSRRRGRARAGGRRWCSASASARCCSAWCSPSPRCCSCRACSRRSVRWPSTT